MNQSQSLAAIGRTKVTRSLGVSFLLMAALGMRATAQTILLDDFNDLNTDGWTLVNDLSELGSQIFDASSGAVELGATGQLDDLDSAMRSGWVGAIWDESSDPLYSNGLYRAKIRINESATNVALRMRTSETAAYAFRAVSLDPISSGSPGVFLFGRTEGGVITHNEIVHFGAPLLHEEWMLEGGAIGDRISMKFWKVGDPEPADPQWEWTDPNPLPLGAFLVTDSIDTVGILATGNPPPWRVSATIDDIYFTPVPEPSSVALSLFGAILALRMLRQNRCRGRLNSDHPRVERADCDQARSLETLD